MTTPATSLGTIPSAFAIHLANGRVLTLEAFAGEPLVLAFVEPAPRDVEPAELERARAELRGLGAAMLVVSRRGLWCFRPDDETQVLAPAEDATTLVGLWERFGVPPNASAVLVLDAALSIELSRVVDHAGPIFTGVVDALAAAGRDLVARRPGPLAMTRRQLLLGSLVAAFSAAVLDGCHAPAPVTVNAVSPVEEAGDVDVTLEINGRPRALRIDPRVTLLDALRERLGLWGTRKGCDQGQCGACTVLVGGRRVNACLMLALAAAGQPITTIEGLAHGEALHPLQRAFIAEDGFQCGYCTSGQIMSACGLLAEHRAAASAGAELDDLAIREGMSGNICRCGAYPNIVAAVRRAARES